MLDDPRVLAGLESVEPAEPRGALASDPVFQAGMNGLDWGMTDHAGERLEPRTLTDDSGYHDEDSSDEESVDSKALFTSYLGLWVLCGTLGAAVSALVFRAQFFRLLWQWSTTATSLWR